MPSEVGKESEAMIARTGAERGANAARTESEQSQNRVRTVRERSANAARTVARTLNVIFWRKTAILCVGGGGVKGPAFVAGSCVP